VTTVPSATAAKIDSLDHLVLTVRDLEATCRFYERALGMTRREFQPERWALFFGSQKINLHVVGTIVDHHVRHATPGSADLCFLTRTPIADVAAGLAALHIEIIEGPGPRAGACGPIQSVYFYDPDENLIEVSNKLY
jgi:catechol 2,3-dioxygenase-like lactoylglutathione lyase family enzyme